MKALLKNKNYMLYWFSSFFLMSSSNILQFVLALHVLDITGSATIFATILSVIIFPRLIFTPLSGYIGDKFPKIKSMLILNILLSVVLLSYIVLYLNDNTSSLIPIYILVIVLEIVEVLYSGASSGVVRQLVKVDELAIAHTFSIIDDGIIGVAAPIIGAFVYSIFGILGGIAIAFALIIISIICKLFINIKEKKESKMSEEEANQNFVTVFMRSIKKIYKNKLLWKLVLLFPLINFFIVSLFSVTNVFVLKVILKITDIQLGFFETTVSVVVTLFPVLFMVNIRKLNIAKHFSVFLKIMTGSLLVSSIVMLFLVHHDHMKLLMVLIILFNTCILVVSVISLNIMNNVLFQTIIPESFISRFMSIVRMLSTISIPLGQLIFGFLGDHVPIAYSFFFSFIGLYICYLLSNKIFKGTTDISELKMMELEL